MKVDESIELLLNLNSNADKAHLGKPYTVGSYRVLAQLGFSIRSEFHASSASVVGFLFSSGIGSNNKKVGSFLSELNETRALSIIEGNSFPEDLIRATRILKNSMVDYVDVYWSVYKWNDIRQRDSIRRNMLCDYYGKEEYNVPH